MNIWAVKAQTSSSVTPDFSEGGYRFGRALPEQDGESQAERRARVRQSFLDSLHESKLVVDTKVDGFLAMTHLWAGEAVYRKQALDLIYISSRQAIEPGVAVPGYVIANWAVLQLPQVLRVNLGRSAELINSCCLMLPFVRTGMTQAYADNPKVFGRWQPRMLEPFEAAHAVTQLLSRDASERDLRNFELVVGGSAEETRITWNEVSLSVNESELDWSANAPIMGSLLTSNRQPDQRQGPTVTLSDDRGGGAGPQADSATRAQQMHTPVRVNPESRSA